MDQWMDGWINGWMDQWMDGGIWPYSGNTPVIHETWESEKDS